MSVFPNVSKNARLKIERANTFIQTLSYDSSSLSKDLFEVTNEPSDKGDGYYLSYKPKKLVQESFSMTIGDAVNNLRESLDYWMTAAMATVGYSHEIHFPFSKNLTDIKTSNQYSKTKKYFPKLADFILNDIKPFWNPNPLLWGVSRLSNLNKHKDFLPVVTFAAINNIEAKTGNLFMKNVNLTMDGNSLGRILRSDVPIDLNSDYTVSVNIVFPQGVEFEHKLVIPTLLEMSEVVLQTINRLDSFIVDLNL